MCGIVGLYLKNKALENQIGRLFEPMLVAMTDRGPDSAGFAIYGDEVAEDCVKLVVSHPDESYDWKGLAGTIENKCDIAVSWFQNSRVAVFKLQATREVAESVFATYAPEVALMSAGRSIEILKSVGEPQHIADTFNLKDMKGSHIIGHTRMATESAVTEEGCHPFSTGMDLCLVHNGSLSNYNRLREELLREGIQFSTENDSEVAAGYLTHRLKQGKSLHEALENALEDLDGFFTFAAGTRDGFAVVRDAIACKPAILAETDDYVAVASEYQALTSLPGIENANVWEPEPARIYAWNRD